MNNQQFRKFTDTKYTINFCRNSLYSENNTIKSFILHEKLYSIRLLFYYDIIKSIHSFSLFNHSFIVSIWNRISKFKFTKSRQPKCKDFYEILHVR